MTYRTLVEAVFELVLLVRDKVDHAKEDNAVADELPETPLAGLLALNTVVRRRRGLLHSGSVRGWVRECLEPFFRVIVVRSRCRSHCRVVPVRSRGSCGIHVGGAGGMEV